MIIPAVDHRGQNTNMILSIVSVLNSGAVFWNHIPGAAYAALPDG
jgi:hypothetical protein